MRALGLARRGARHALAGRRPRGRRRARRRRRRRRPGRHVRRHGHAPRGARRPARRPARRHRRPHRRPRAADGVPHPRAPRPPDQRRLAVPLRAPADRRVPRRAQGGAGRPRRRSPRVARELAPLAAAPPESWQQELERKEHSWRLGLARAAAADEDAAEIDEVDEEFDEDEPDEPEVVVLSDEDEARLRHRLAAAPDDAAALLLVGLVRDGVALSGSHVRKLFWTRPLSAAAVAEAERDIERHRRGPRAARLGRQGQRRLLHDVLRQPVLEVHRALVRAPRLHAEPGHHRLGAASACWPPSRSPPASAGAWSPARCCSSSPSPPTASTASSRATRARSPSSARGSTRCSTAPRSTSRSPAWRSARAAMGDPVWLLACAAITLQTARHMADFSFGGSQREAIGSTPQPPVEQPLDAAGAGRRGAPREPARGRERRRTGAAAAARPRARRLAPRSTARRGVRWVKKMIAFPIGERFAVISITAALFTPRVTFIVLLAWGGLARALHARPAGSCGRCDERRRRHRRRRRSRRRTRSPSTATTARSRARSGRCSAGRCGCRGRRSSLAGLLPLLAAVAIGGGDTSRPVAAAVLAWVLLTAGASSGARAAPEDPLGRAAAAARDRVHRADLDRRARGARRLPGRLRAAGRAHVPPLRPRLPAAPSRRDARAVGERALRRLGRAAGARLPAAGRRARCRPATSSPPRCSARPSSARPSYGWVAVGRVQRPLEYEDEEDEGQ